VIRVGGRLNLSNIVEKKPYPFAKKGQVL